MENKNNINSQILDLRPAAKAGRNFCIGDDPSYPRKNSVKSLMKSRAYYLGVGVDSQEAPILHDPNFDIDELFEKNQLEFARLEAERERREQAVVAEEERLEIEKMKWLKEEQERARYSEQAYRKAISPRKRVEKKSFFQRAKKEKDSGSDNSFNESGNFHLKDLLFPQKFAFAFDLRNSIVSFVIGAIVLSVGFGSFALVSKGLSLKGRVLGASTDGYLDLTGAIKDISQQNFEGSSEKFAQAVDNFSQASDDLQSVGGFMMDATKYIPFASKLSSGKNIIEAGKHFSQAGKSLNEVVKIAAEIKNPISADQQSDFSLLEIFQTAEKNITAAKTELDAAQENMDKISIDDLPEDKKNKFLLLKQQLPEIRSAMGAFLGSSHILTDLIGANGPRKYLFLFQNNSEMRATGGFIGSYGLMDISNGHIRKFFIDGIFNPDGQLKDRIVPPIPIQKISSTWSMHDSNWFADFPISAQKAILFYEKTGGPTADGVIAITPTLMQKMLEVTGPIEMPDYGVTLDANNFIELTQYKVEVDYDKQENQPKKILADLAPLVLDKLMSSNNLESVLKTVEVFMSGLREKHILLYSQDSNLQKIIKSQGWSGEILPAQKDYISVINTNINGFKTDAVIEESIEHKSEIQSDGSIIDTVSVSRKHNGGNSEYEWLNKVNADYMRVYVPEGSKLLEVSGQTREVNASPVDYDALGFKRDSEVQKEENGIIIDENSGTRVYNENGKTVFANWTYASPQETMNITYKYQLPFRLFQLSVGKGVQADSYSLVAQKQSGSLGSAFVSQIVYPSSYELKMKLPNSGSDSNGEIKNVTRLDSDRFFGAVFKKK